MRILRRSSLLLAAGASLFLTGCIERQMRRMTAPESKSVEEVFQASEAVLRARYYQVKRHSPQHLVALTPVQLNSNTYSRSRVDIYVFLENGFYMPNVSVQTYLDTSDPPLQTGPSSPEDSAFQVAPRFPMEAVHHGAAVEEWRSVYFDRTLALEIRNAILDRLKGQAPAEKNPAVSS